MARGNRDVGHFSELWRFCTLTPPDLEFITKVLKDNFEIYLTQIYVLCIGWSQSGCTPEPSASTQSSPAIDC